MSFLARVRKLERLFGKPGGVCGACRRPPAALPDAFIPDNGRDVGLAKECCPRCGAYPQVYVYTTADKPRLIADLRHRLGIKTAKDEEEFFQQYEFLYFQSDPARVAANRPRPHSETEIPPEQQPQSEPAWPGDEQLDENSFR
jgi:hypothetical protein